MTCILSEFSNYILRALQGNCKWHSQGQIRKFHPSCMVRDHNQIKLEGIKDSTFFLFFSYSHMTSAEKKRMGQTDPWREHVLAKSLPLGEGVILAGYEVQDGRKSSESPSYMD